MKQEECVRSPTRNHEWVYPRLEDSVDKNRSVIEPYCKHCFEKIKTKHMETRKCPFCNEKIEVIATENKDELKFISHRRYKDIMDEDDNSEGNVHCRNFPTTICEGSEKIFKDTDSRFTK